MAMIKEGNVGSDGKYGLEIVDGKAVGKFTYKDKVFYTNHESGVDLLAIVDLIDAQVNLPGDFDRAVFGIIKGAIKSQWPSQEGQG